jgi:hypothetical protein
MKDFQQPKFKVGDTVFLAESNWNSIPIKCPDCLGQKIWEVVTPAGEVFSTYCRTCWHGYDGCSGTVSEYGYRATTRQLTIGLVNVRQSNEKSEIQYMCEETGVGSGSMWNQQELFRSEFEAEMAAQRRVEALRVDGSKTIDQDKKAQRSKDNLVLEDCPRKKMQDEIDRLKQQVKDLKYKARPKKRVKKS